MASTTAGGTASGAATAYDQYEEERGQGWVTFAGVMIALVGTMNVIYGIAAISNSKFYVHGTKYILSDLKTYGWLNLGVGAIQIIAALGIFSRSSWGRWIGIITASLNAIVQITWIPAYPLSSLALFAVDILVIYGLVAYGSRHKAEQL
jgi:hypothetical protein